MARDKSLRTSLIVLLTAVGVGGCSERLQLLLFNNTTNEVTVQARGESAVIGLRRSAKFEYPQSGENWTLRLATADCDYEYQVPKTLEHYPWSPGSNGPLKAQVEKEFDIYLLPPTATEVRSVSELGSLQQDGFPLHPIAKICR